MKEVMQKTKLNWQSHLHSIEENYGQHFWFGFKTAMQLLLAGLILLLHSCIPTIFPRTSSRLVSRIHAALQVRREKISHQELRYPHE